MVGKEGGEEGGEEKLFGLCGCMVGNKDREMEGLEEV